MRSKYNFIQFSFDKRPPILHDGTGPVVYYYAVGTLRVNGESHNNICVDFYYQTINKFSCLVCDGVRVSGLSLRDFYYLRGRTIALTDIKQDPIFA